MSLEEDPKSPTTDTRLPNIIGPVVVLVVFLGGSFAMMNSLMARDKPAGNPASAGSTPTPPTANTNGPGTPIGFDFTGQVPEDPAGDRSAASHLFIHPYRIPGAGFVTGVTYLNDREADGIEIPETVTLLILRPGTHGWTVIYNVTLPPDDHPGVTSGVAYFKLDPPAAVEKGDIFAHWQEGASGPIPLNYEEAVVDGESAGQFGFKPSDLKVGQFIRATGFSGRRDYFLNLIFEPAH